VVGKVTQNAGFSYRNLVDFEAMARFLLSVACLFFEQQQKNPAKFAGLCSSVRAVEQPRRSNRERPPIGWPCLSRIATTATQKSPAACRAL
jgi:hypothetical protein